MMKKTRTIFLLLIVLFVLPFSLGMKTANDQKKDTKKEQQTDDNVINTMLSSKPGADPLTLVAGSDDYLILEHYCGLLILDRNFLEPFAEIPAKDIELKTQGDEAFSYSLDGNTLYLKRMGSGKSFTFNIADKVLQVEQNKDQMNRMDSFKSLSEGRLEEVLGRKCNAQGIQGDNWIFILIPDPNKLGNSQLMIVDQDTGSKRTKNLRDLVETKHNVSIFLDEKTLNSKGFVEKGRAYLPLRSILEGQDYEVNWNQKDSSIVIKNKNQKILMVPDGQRYCLIKEGKKRSYDFYVRENRTYLSQKFFKEIAGLNLSVNK